MILIRKNTEPPELTSETDNKTPYQGILIWYLQSMLGALNAVTD